MMIASFLATSFFVQAPVDENELYSLRYAEFVVPLVKAVQELTEENKELKLRLDEMESRMNKLER